MLRASRDFVQHIHDLSAFFEDGSQVILPGKFTDPFYSLIILLLHDNQFGLRCDMAFEDPLTQLANTVKFFFKFEAFGSLVSFVTARGGMALRLSDIGDMDEGRDMVLTR